jgi:hypothetical protein
MTDILEGPWLLTAPGHKGFLYVACNITPREMVTLYLKTLQSGLVELLKR